mmetsp:Transcript_29248/g.67339  ORF Transcript_29248/g.67339 Transcript_29248/m.67339 type:complete len:522 (-) Transcript_29248:188-1753(-)
MALSRNVSKAILSCFRLPHRVQHREAARFLTTAVSHPAAEQAGWQHSVQLQRPRDAGIEFIGAGKSASSHRRRDLGAVDPSQTGQFYQRTLPDAQVPFSSQRGKQMFREALAAGHMENYFHLAEQYQTQDEPTFCGLTTLAMVLNSLQIDPMATWKGAWRWYSEQTLTCACVGPDQVREEGLTFDMFDSLARCQGADVDARRAPTADEDQETFINVFRQHVLAVSTSTERECVVISYSRESLGQTGTGHFSPIGGYHEGSDSVLILDVARFKYPPHWVPLRQVVQAMEVVDPDTGKPRGFLHLRLPQLRADQRRSPLYGAHLPAASSRKLARALEVAIASQCEAFVGTWESPLTAGMRRWLSAASVAEPQVLRQLLQVGDASGFTSVLSRLSMYPLFQDLCKAYDNVIGLGGLPATFPPLRFMKSHAGDVDQSQASQIVMDLGLHNCGELWVLFLLLLPNHLRRQVSEQLAGEEIAQAMALKVRGPWALPLEAYRAALSHLLPAQTAESAARCLKSNVLPL